MAGERRRSATATPRGIGFALVVVFVFLCLVVIFGGVVPIIRNGHQVGRNDHASISERVGEFLGIGNDEAALCVVWQPRYHAK